mgnify:CR=1 FL=1
MIENTDRVEPSIRPILDEFKNELLKIYGDSLKKVILYGFYARGEQKHESDIDVAIILEGEIRSYEEMD